jgi:hypothetical protein
MEIIIGVIIGLFFLIGIFIPYIINPRYKFNKSEYEASQTTSKALADAIIKAASDKAASDKAASDKAASDKVASDKAASDKAAADKAASDKAASDKATADKATSDKATADKATSDKATADKATADKAAPGGEEITFTTRSQRMPSQQGIQQSSRRIALVREQPLVQENVSDEDDTSRVNLFIPSLIASDGNGVTASSEVENPQVVPEPASTTTPGAKSEAEKLEGCKDARFNVIYDASLNYKVYRHASTQVSLNSREPITYDQTREKCKYPVYIYNPNINPENLNDRWEPHVLEYNYARLNDLPFKFN